MSLSDACLHGGACRNAPGSFTCTCGPRWSGPRCELDVDECGQGSNPCQNQGRCSNYPGGFNCTCEGPWEGEVCDQEKDECRDEPCEHSGVCIRRRAADGGGVQCLCRRGWRGSRCREDRNECNLEPCLNGGTCVNEEGGFRCACPEGITGSTCGNDTVFDKGQIASVTFPFLVFFYLRVLLLVCACADTGTFSRVCVCVR